jgi:acyl dehydratase
LRFVKPDFTGNTISARVTILVEREHKRPELGFVVNQRGETVLVCDHLLLCERRAPADLTESP